jgi:hypothetical protein
VALLPLPGGGSGAVLLLGQPGIPPEALYSAEPQVTCCQPDNVHEPTSTDCTAGNAAQPC